MVSWTSSASCAASLAARDGFAVRPAMARASASLDHIQRMPRLKARSSSMPAQLIERARGAGTCASTPCRRSVTTATCRTSRGPSAGATRRGSGVSRSPRTPRAEGATPPARIATLARESSDAARQRHGRLRARVVRRQRNAPLGPSTGRSSLVARPRVARHELRERRLEGRGVDELSLLDDAPADRGRAARAPSGTARRAAGESACSTIASSSGGTSGAYVVGGSTMPGAHDVEQRLAAQAAVQRATGEDLPEDDAERVEIASPVDALAARLLGRHVAELALEDARLLGEEARAGDAEVGDLHGALEGEEDVLRADVAVDDLERLPCLVLLLVRVVEALGRLGDDPRAEPGRDRVPFDRAAVIRRPRSQPFHVLHREQQALVADVLELVDLHDVRVVEARREVRLLDEHRAEAPRAAVRRQDALEDEELDTSPPPRASWRGTPRPCPPCPASDGCRTAQVRWVSAEREARTFSAGGPPILS